MVINYDIFDSKNIRLNEMDWTVEIPFYPSTIENIDQAKITATVETFKSIPMPIYAGPQGSS